MSTFSLLGIKAISQISQLGFDYANRRLRTANFAYQTLLYRQFTPNLNACAKAGVFPSSTCLWTFARLTIIIWICRPSALRAKLTLKVTPIWSSGVTASHERGESSGADFYFFQNQYLQARTSFVFKFWDEIRLEVRNIQAKFLNTSRSEKYIHKTFYENFVDWGSSNVLMCGLRACHSYTTLLTQQRIGKG